MTDIKNTKELEAKLEAENHSTQKDSEEEVPAYEAGESSHQPVASASEEHPPDYPTPTIPFAEGDPDELIKIPFVVSHISYSLKRFVTGKTTVKQRVTTRTMKRSMYLESYAKDSEGNFAGTGKPAADAKMVYVACMDKDDMKNAQVETAFGKEHWTDWRTGHGLVVADKPTRF